MLFEKMKKEEVQKRLLGTKTEKKEKRNKPNGLFSSL